MNLYSGLSAKSDFQAPLAERVRPSRRWSELEKSKPLRSLLNDLGQGLGLAAFIVAAVVVPIIFF
jgi:hypothetical protein